MNCMKCGCIIAADQVFCEDCLAEMEKYPVPQDTPIMLPPRDDTASQKRSASKRIRKPEDQVARLKATVWVLLILFTALLIAFFMVTSTLIQVLNSVKNLPQADSIHTVCVEECFT